MKPSVSWIPGPWRGRLAIAARPRGEDWLEDELRSLSRAGINIIVSLLEKDEAGQLGLMDEARIAEANGLGYLSFPIPDRGVPASAAAAVSLIATIADALDGGKNVAVHCRQGIGRSGLIAAGVLESSGLSPAQAIEIVSNARGLNIPETPEQRLWLERLPSVPPILTR